MQGSSTFTETEKAAGRLRSRAELRLGASPEFDRLVAALLRETKLPEQDKMRRSRRFRRTI